MKHSSSKDWPYWRNIIFKFSSIVNSPKIFGLSLKKTKFLSEIIFPLSKFIKLAKHFKKVVFPEPLGPEIEIISPPLKLKFISFKIDLFEYFLESFSTESIT